MSAPESSAAEPAWQRRFRAARVSLPSWARNAPHRLVYATNASGVWQVMTWDLRTGEHTQVTDKPTGVLGGVPLPDGSGVVWFDDHGGDEVGRHVVTPFGGGRSAPLVDGLAEGWSAGVSLRPGRTAVGISTQEGVTVTVVDSDEAREVYAHRMPAEVSGLSADASLLAIGHTEHGDVMHPDLRVVDAATGGVVADISDGDGNTVVAAGWSPVEGDSRLVLLANRSGRTRPELCDVATGRRHELVLDLPGEVWLADWWPDGSALLLGHDHLGRTSLLRYGLADDVAEPLDLADGTIRGARVRPDGAIWYAFNSSAKPSQVRVRDAEGDRALLVPPGDAAPEGAAYRSIHYDNGEGGTVHAFLAVPPGDGPFPLTVDIHGGPQAQTADSFDPGVQAWVDHGFAVLMPNYRGSTGYGKDWEDAVLGDPGRPELVDVRAGRDLLVSEGLADAERIVLSGASWGGYLTLLGLGTQPDAWSAGVAVVPVADYVSAFADESPILQDFDRTLFGGGPDEQPELFAQRSPISHVDHVRAPVLIITGKNDTRCPKRQVDNYVGALAGRGIPHAYDVFDAGHGSLQVDEVVRQQILALDFVSEHLRTPPAQR